MLYAALIAMKTTFALFAVLNLAAISLVVYIPTKKLWTSLKWAAAAGIFTALFLSPWIFLHAPHYLAALHARHASETLPGEHATEHLNLFSLRSLSYGSTTAHYSGLVAAIILCGILSVCATVRSDNSRLRFSALMTGATAVVGAVAYLVLIGIFGPLLDGYPDALRYFTPFAIGIAPAVFGLTAFHVAQSERVVPRIVSFGLPLVVAFVSVAGFWPSLHGRVEQSLTAGSELAFARFAQSPVYLEYCRQVMDGSVRDTVSKAQSVVPPGEPVIVWINAPFYLNFARNPITDVEPAGLATGWATLPPARYVIWEYRGFATRTLNDYAQQAEGDGVHERMIATRSLQFIHQLAALGNSGQLLYDNGNIAVFHLTESLPGPAK
jgi:hypothetical protein